MAVYLATSADYLQRTASLPSPATDYTVMYWVRFQATTPAFPAYRLCYALLDDPAVYAQYREVWAAGPGSVFIPPLNNRVVLEAWDTAIAPPVDRQDGGPDPIGTWVHHTMTTAAGLTHRLWVDGAVLATQVLSTAAYAVGFEMLGGDSYSTQDQIHAYARSWSVVLSAAEIARERSSATAVRTANLQMDTPLTANLLDVSGNGRDWTQVGSGTFVAGPTLPPADTEGILTGWAGATRVAGPRLSYQAIPTGGWER